jgi:hypothetical protein
MKKQSSDGQVETRPAILLFEHGTLAGTIYAHRVGGIIVEAYRGYGYQYDPVAAHLRTDTRAR